jgi:hypothetical protein
MEKKEQVMSIMKDLENKVITTYQATELILILFDVSESFANIGRIILSNDIEIVRNLDGFKKFSINGEMIHNTKRLYERLQDLITKNKTL